MRSRFDPKTVLDILYRRDPLAAELLKAVFARDDDWTARAYADFLEGDSMRALEVKQRDLERKREVYRASLITPSLTPMSLEDDLAPDQADLPLP